MKDIYEYLKVDELHEIAIYRKGNIEGEKVIYCHGGPGGCIKEYCFSCFDLFKFDVIAFDQRGCGNSKPFAETYRNTLEDLVEDIEKIRKHYNLDKIYLYGGSFGTTLALCYAIKYPNNVKGLVLRGIFLGRQKDIYWLYQDGASKFFPESFEKYREFIDEHERENLLKAYSKIFNSDNQELVEKACKHWSCWEMSVVKLFPKVVDFSAEISNKDISLAKLECHYFVNNLWFNDDNYILNNIDKIKNHKIIILHGRYDIDCIPEGAYELYKALDNCDIRYVIAGHGANDLDNNAALVKACDDIICRGNFHKISIDKFQFNNIINSIKLDDKYNIGDIFIVKNSDTLEYKKFVIKEMTYNNEVYTYKLDEYL